MIIPEPRVPANSLQWAHEITSMQQETRAALGTLDSDIAARFQSLATTMDILNNQVSRLERYAAGVQEIRILFGQTSGFPMNTGWATRAAISTAVPDGATHASVYATGQAYVTTGLPLMYNAQSQLYIQGNPSGPSFGILAQNSAGDVPQDVSFVSSFGLDVPVGPGTVDVQFDLYNGDDDFGYVTSSFANLLVFVTFYFDQVADA